MNTSLSAGQKLSIAALIGLVSLGLTITVFSPEPQDRGELQRFRRGADRWQEDIKIVDNREVIVNTTRTPWSAVCKIIATFPDGSRSEGSGTMVGPHHCLTARHVVYDGDTVAKSIEIIPGYDGSKPESSPQRKPFGSAGWNYIRYWKDKDVALIITNSNIGEKSSWLGMDWDARKGLDVHLAGYPADKDDAERMYYDAGEIAGVEDSILKYEIGTYKGQSGSGLFKRVLGKRLSEQDKFYVIGVHTHGGKDYNSGSSLQSLSKTLSDMRYDKFPEEWGVRIPKE